REKGGLGWALYQGGVAAAERLDAGQGGPLDRARLAIARRVVFARIKAKIGSRLEFLICGSAALAPRTQRWVELIRIPVFQVYGLTETTGIVTMDRPGGGRPGTVGIAIDGCEVRLGDGGELQCRGPNLFTGYWKRPEATAAMLRDGWLCTGDQAELDADGRL